MAASKSLIGIGAGLAAVIIVAVFLYTSGSTNNSSAPLSVPLNATQATPLNATQTTPTVHHYEVKVNEMIKVGERT